MKDHMDLNRLMSLMSCSFKQANVSYTVMYSSIKYGRVEIEENRL